jgi:hypothetical protein
MPGVNRQGQAHIASTASRLRSIDPQPASISPTINISIVFICAFFVDCGQIICCPAIKNDSSASTLKRACRMCAARTGTFAALGACATRARRAKRFTVVASCTSYTSYTGQWQDFHFGTLVKILVTCPPLSGCSSRPLNSPSDSIAARSACVRLATNRLNQE